MFAVICGLVLLAACSSAASGALIYYIVKRLIFCGEFCDWVAARNSSVTCDSFFGTSYIMWGIGTSLLFAAALGGGILRFVDARAYNAEVEEEVKGGFAPSEPIANPTKREFEADNGGDTSQYYGSNDTAVNDEDEGPPAGYEWNEEAALYWGEADQLYYDTTSGQYYDPKIDQWYDPKKDLWYSC